MTTPRLAHSTKFGRLYQRPETPASELKPHADALRNGLLMPSVTNVIDVLNKPFLQTWYAKRAAEDAVQVNTTHPGLMESKPQDAIKWIAGAALRTSNSAAELGDKVHEAVEVLANGEVPEITPDIKGYVKSWEDFVSEQNPNFRFLEATAYGKIGSGLKYAGTADFIAEFNGKLYVGDYKTGKSIHTEAALQLSALAHAREIYDEVLDQMIPMPKIDGGLVVHLTANGYKLHVVEDLAKPYEVFVQLRNVWEFYSQNSATMSPLFLEERDSL